MGSNGGRTVVFVVTCLIVLLMCCLCVVVGGGAAWLSLFLPRDRELRSTWNAPRELIPPIEEVVPADPTALARNEIPLEPGLEEETQRQLASVVVPIADPIQLVERLGGVEDAPEVLATSAETLREGTVRTFWATNMDTIENFQVPAALAYVSDHVYFWVDRDIDYDRLEVKDLVDEFERNAYPANRELFGREWSPGIDGDVHLNMLYARGLGNAAAGYYSSSDEFSPIVKEYSNGVEIFYLNADTIGIHEGYTDSVLAHEFQHMIHWYQDRNEDTWMNEGLSELAVLVNGYDTGGFDYLFAMDPDITMTRWPIEPGTAGSNYGQAFLFLAYFLDRFGREAVQALVSDPANGLDSMDRTLASLDARDQETGLAITAEDVFRDWAVAMLLQDETVGDGRYAIRSYASAPRIETVDSIDECPFRPRREEVMQYGIDAFEIDCPGQYSLRFDGEEVVRVVPADPHSGDYAFWSNRGDESDMTLTRAFDFGDLEGPIELRHWIWYDLEEGWDYAYLEVSEDGGETWTILTTPSGTSEDPSGSSYGWAYNGFSGGGPQWIEETIDLSEFAGKAVLLRYEYVTDAALNGEGILVDDIRIDALYYEENFEAGDGGWEAEGFVRLYNRLPQTYRVAVVQEGRETSISEIALDAARRGRIDLELGEYDRVTLIVIGTTRYSWQPAPYTFEAVPR